MDNVDNTYFGVKMDFDSLDEKMQKFVQLRNELAELAAEIGFEVESGLLVLEKKTVPTHGKRIVMEPDKVVTTIW